MVTNSKRKGSTGERELCAFLAAQGFPAHRNDQTFKGGRGLPDVAAEGLERFHIECKRCEHLNLGAAFEQAQRDAVGKIPVVIHRRNRQPWLITLKLSDFLKEVKQHDR